MGVQISLVSENGGPKLQLSLKTIFVLRK